MIRFIALAAALTLPAASAVAQTSRPVTVLYAGSLVTPMEGPVKSALAAAGIDFEGQGGGSKMLANLIASGAKNPDAFVSVDPKLVTGLDGRIAYAVTFARTRLGIGWSNQSRFAAAFAAVAAGKTPLLAALQTRGLAIGRTDPQLDPKGAYTIEAMIALAGKGGERTILGDDENQAQTFPEEDLLARIETGQVDVGFFYATEAAARGLNFLPLPSAALPADRITYTLALLKGAPHPQTAAAFADFVLRGAGKRILERAGLTYLDAPKVLIGGTAAGDSPAPGRMTAKSNGNARSRAPL